MTATAWRVTAIPLTRRLSELHATLNTTTRNASVSSRAIACRRASPLVVAVQGVHQYGSTCRVDGSRGASARPREPAARRSVRPVITDRASLFTSGNTVASAADRRRQRQFRLRLPLFNRYRRLITTEQMTQVRLTGDAL
jgi:hypothetical protein